jgi:3D (Asp-Asp-Asp) domain-containing protein
MEIQAHRKRTIALKGNPFRLIYLVWVNRFPNAGKMRFFAFLLLIGIIPLLGEDAPQVNPANLPANLPPKDGKFGGAGKWTMYYIHEVETVEKERGVSHTVELLTGERVTVNMTPASSRTAKVEAAAAMTDKSGNRRVGALIGNVWHELPEGAFGLGNRKNPLVPWVHVAADQSLYPFGSRVFVPAAIGYTTPEGKVLDGYFWVGDTGSAIKGNLRFDLFVGPDGVYRDMMERGKMWKWKPDTYVEKPPKVPAEISPTTAEGMHELLMRTGDLAAPGVPGFTPHAFMSIPPEMVAALTSFQKKYPDIPSAEYGNPMGATTIWFLTQAAADLAKKDAAAKDTAPAPAPAAK